MIRVFEDDDGLVHTNPSCPDFEGFAGLGQVVGSLGMIPSDDLCRHTACQVPLVHRDRGYEPSVAELRDIRDSGHFVPGPF